MTKNIVRVLMLSAFVVAGLAMTASAQNPTFTKKTEIGFDFYIGSKQMPAGEYVFKFVGDETVHGVLLVQQVDGDAQMFVQTFPYQNTDNLKSGAIVFNKQGDRSYLAGIQLGDGKYVHQVLKNTSDKVAKREARRIAQANSAKSINTGTDE